MLAILAFLAAAVCLWMAIRAPSGATAGAASADGGRLDPNLAGPAAPPATVMKPAAEPASGRPGWLRTLDAPALLQAVSAERVLPMMMKQSQLSVQTWRQDLLPAIERYAELVQLVPASESHHHAHVGGLLTHTLETVLAAMTLRNGYLLPRSAAAEQIAQQRDHWTYVVFLAALLHDVGKPLSDLKVEWVRPGSSKALRWIPTAGSLKDLQASEYQVSFYGRSERDYAAHSRIAVTMLQSLVPAQTLAFLAREPDAMQSLVSFLSGEDKTGAIAEIVRRADGASTKRALSHGSRARFPTAATVPLIELLMGAMQDMLRVGGQMPLNRDGAIGWVYDGSVWFVAKRLADQVREYVAKHSPDEALPGEAKNDRLFDTWQEYGCLVPNPSTSRSVWFVRVHGEDGSGYSHRLSMLRFKLDKVWTNPAHYPEAMAGRIEVLAGRDAESEAAPVAGLVPAPAQAEPAAASTPAGRADAAAIAALEGSPAAAGPSANAPVQVRSPPADPATAAARDDSVATNVDAPPVPAGGVRAPAFKKRAKAKELAEDAPRSPSTVPAQVADAAPSRNDVVRATPAAQEDDGLLDDEDAAGKTAGMRRAPREAESAPSVDPRQQQLTLPTSLAHHLPKIPSPGGKPVSELAVRFIRWLQSGLAQRQLKYNETGAPVHFVAEGMALVSPLIFRLFAESEAIAATGADDAAIEVQREVLKAGRHVQLPGGKNIHQYQIIGRGGAKTNARLSTIVLASPEQYVSPVPPVNAVLAIAA